MRMISLGCYLLLMRKVYISPDGIQNSEIQKVVRSLGKDGASG